ncbi:helix-turn-helix domain-containing protein [Methanosphaerula subterraneus]|uniref:helix-turn-helix domain-containing protein n=1 Tax=Methanosphaerula subterraneus TaxID=3350244 RepID=UPI003F83365D
MIELQNSDCLTTDEVAKITNRSKNTVYRWTRNGLLKSFKTKLRTVYIKKEDFEKFLIEYQIPVN